MQREALSQASKAACVSTSVYIPAELALEHWVPLLSLPPCQLQGPRELCGFHQLPGGGQERKDHSVHHSLAGKDEHV